MLGKPFGVSLFQQPAVRLAIVAAGSTPEETKGMTPGASRSANQHQVVPIGVVQEHRLVPIPDRDNSVGHQSHVEVGKDWCERHPRPSIKQKPGRGDIVAPPV